MILAGEHAVVYGRPALVAALDLRLTVTLEVCAPALTPPAPSLGTATGAASPAVVLDLPDIDHRTTTSWRDLHDYALEIRQRWERYAAAPSSERFRALRGDDPAHLVKVALGEAAAWLATRPHAAILASSCRLSIDSAIPVGSGFGSSAATAIGVLGALFAAEGLSLAAPELERLALEVERRQHGTPSGVDGAAALQGGLLWAQRRPDGGLTTERLAGSSLLLSYFSLHHTGTPPEPTGAVVASVRQRLDSAPVATGHQLDRIAAGALSRR